MQIKKTEVSHLLMLNNEHEYTESTRIKKDKKDLKDLDRFERFTFPRFANSDRWFSPKATHHKKRKQLNNT